MKIEVKIDENARETKVIIVTDTVDAEVQELMKRIAEERPQILAGFAGDTVQGRCMMTVCGGKAVYVHDEMTKRYGIKEGDIL